MIQFDMLDWALGLVRLTNALLETTTPFFSFLFFAKPFFFSFSFHFDEYTGINYYLYLLAFSKNILLFFLCRI